jgi:hypothetical protein
MKIKLTAVIVSVLLFISVCKAQTNMAEEEMPLVIVSVDVKAVNELYATTWVSKSIPPSEGKQFNKFVFDLEIAVKLENGKIWDKPFIVMCQTPDDGKFYYVLNNERLPLTDKSFNYFRVNVDSRKKGFAKAKLFSYKKEGDEQGDMINSFPFYMK